MSSLYKKKYPGLGETQLKFDLLFSKDQQCLRINFTYSICESLQVWARSFFWTWPLNVQGVREREKAESEQGGMGGAAVERAWAWMLHWGLVFWWKTVAELGQLQQQLQQERLGPDKTTERERVVKEQGPKSPEGAGLWHTAISVKRSPKQKRKDKSELN